jgi:hypothetical protein
MARIRTLWAAINATYWFYPALASLAAVALAALTIHLDRSGWSEWLSGLEGSPRRVPKAPATCSASSPDR